MYQKLRALRLASARFRPRNLMPSPADSSDFSWITPSHTPFKSLGFACARCAFKKITQERSGRSPSTPPTRRPCCTRRIQVGRRRVRTTAGKARPHHANRLNPPCCNEQGQKRSRTAQGGFRSMGPLQRMRQVSRISCLCQRLTDRRHSGTDCSSCSPLRMRVSHRRLLRVVIWGSTRLCAQETPALSRRGAHSPRAARRSLAP